MRPLRIDVPETPGLALAASLYAPSDAPVNGNGVAHRPAWLIPAPPGDDRKGAWLPLSRLARRIATRGGMALLFDPRGCGESPGEFSDADWDGWLCDLRAALATLRQLAKASRVVVWGGRLGARLAVESFADRPEQVEQFIFWDPLYDAEAWFREWQRRSRFRLGASASVLDALDLDGFVFSPTLRRQLAERRTVPPEPVGVPTRFLCLSPSGKPSAAVAAWASAWRTAPETAAIQPFWLASDPTEASGLLEASLNDVPMKPELMLP